MPMSAVTTIRDPIGIPSGGKNPFTDDIDDGDRARQDRRGLGRQ